ncbi:MAG: DUF445 family protein [Pyrinomonadaceae bacterium]|nr:DUF445 family protein [Pyrinomonadaceae bacterium]
MEFFSQLFESISAFLAPVFSDIRFQLASLIIFATFHGYAGAWLAVRMLFRPRKPLKIFGLTIFPQGMIPRHRNRLAAAIGKAVGEELVSQETIIEELFGKEFLQRKIQNVVDSYTEDLLSQSYPSIVETLPANLREPVLDAISTLQIKIASHIENVLANEETFETIRGFVERRVDEVLSRRVNETVDDETFREIVSIIENRVRSIIYEPEFENKIRTFISSRVDDLADTVTPLGDLFTNDAVDLLKEKAEEQIEPIVHRLAELATAERTRNQISAMIKHEVHDYYEQLPFFKRIFVSRENLLKEVDDLVNESLPKRVEETLRGDFFAQEARGFLNSAIDGALSRPLPEIAGKIAPEQLSSLKEQVTRGILSVLRGDQMIDSIVSYASETLEKLRPHSVSAILHTVHPEAEEKLKLMLSKGLLNVLNREETSNIINSVLADQIDGLLAAPIGKLSDHISEEKVRAAGVSLTDTIIAAAKEKLPEAIKEFDVGGVVEEKIKHYPAEKLENLVLSVAKEHLRTIELFGAGFGLAIGIIQAIQFYFWSGK